MHKVYNLFKDRNFILFLGLMLGLLLGDGAKYTRPLIFPVLALVILISTVGVSNRIFHSPRLLLIPTLIGIIMSYVVLGGFLLGLTTLFISDEATWRGLKILASVPPRFRRYPFYNLL